METRKGTVVQKYKVKVIADVPGTGSSKDAEVQQVPDGTTQSSDKGVADGFQGIQGDGSQGVQGDGSQGFQGENLNQDGDTASLQFNNFQDRIDYAVQHALINQSGVLVNTLSNMVKSMVDGLIAEYQATGPVYLPGDVMREQFRLKPKDAENLYRHPYPEWFERVPLPNQFKVPDFSKFLGQDSVSTYEHVSRFLAQCGEASAVNALRGMITPIREKFSSQDFDSLSHLAQKVTLHEQRFAEARKNFKRVNHVCPYIYGSDDDDDDDDSEIAAAEWVRNKKVIPCQWVKSSGKEERYDFDIIKADKIFDLLLREKQIQLPTGNTIPSAEELGKKRYCKWHNSGSYSTNDCKIFRQQIQAAIEGGKIEFDDSKRPMKVDGNPFPVNMVHTAGRTADGGRARGFQVNSAKIINKYQKKYDRQQERHYEEDDGGFDSHWGCEFFRFCWNKGMRLPSIEDCPGCGNVAESSSRSYNGSNRLRQARVPVHQRLGPVNRDCNQEDDEDRKTQWCPSGSRVRRKCSRRLIEDRLLQGTVRCGGLCYARGTVTAPFRGIVVWYTSGQSKTSRIAVPEEVEQEINHQLKKTKPKQEWRVKIQVPAADEATADEAKRLAKGKSVVTASVNMVFTLPAEFGVKQADVDKVEEKSAKLILLPEQAVFEKPEGIENRHLKGLYVNGYVNGKPISKMMVDGGAALNLMPYATFRKLGRNAEDFIKTNMVLVGSMA
uniref:Retrotransposon protein, putative, unclassified n=1 Tax=Oryza sativa subsp. japonica TaxID=39947 RepID=Q6UU75_ORYSJ|nr:hypothetical protein OSJNBa0023H09.22 [Oryza sativa Japonica Group]